MKVINLGEKASVINQFVRELRDVNIQRDRMRFRHNVRRVGHAMAYEISKVLNYEACQVQTPLGKSTMQLPSDELVIGTVFRAGLPFHEGFLDVFDKAGNAFLSAYRYYTGVLQNEIGVKIEYLASPCLDNKTFLLVDPMLATGESMVMAYNAFCTKGHPKRLILASVLASECGVAHLREIFPSDDVCLYTAVIDPVLNESKYIVPGLGDAGDLMFGEKI